MKKFALIGVSGYIAPRHLRAIKENNCDLLASFDISDSVGVIDSFFPKSSFFTEFERFDRHIEMLKQNRDTYVDYLSICSPNYLHDAHIRTGLRWGSDVICEKPLVLTIKNIDLLSNLELKYNRKINTILQLRLHPSIIKLKQNVDSSPKDKIFDIDLTYITSRGNWYFASWKGDDAKSGGITTNIGIHFFDVLCWIFGDVVTNLTHIREHDRSAGYLEFKRARVRWFLSINEDTLPKNVDKTYRSLIIDDEEFEFSDGFTDLHTKSYENILNGTGFGLEESRKCIQIVQDIRYSELNSLKNDYHPFAKFPKSKHPFLINV